MNGLSNIIGFICVALINVILWAMLVRAVMSLFTDGGPIFDFVYSITEPVIVPIRRALARRNVASGLPIDLSFLIAYVLLSVLSNLLSLWF